MEYPYPPEFPQESRALVLAESIRAARDFDEAKQQARFLSAIEGPLRNYILRVLLESFKVWTDEIPGTAD